MNGWRTGKFAREARPMSWATQGSRIMKSLLLAGIMSAALATAGHADEYWVAGDRTTGKCNILTSEPVIFGLPAYDGTNPEYRTSWASGPYTSLDDAKLACTVRHQPMPAAGS